MNTSISPPVAATPVAEVPVTLPIGDAGLSFNDCGGVDGDTPCGGPGKADNAELAGVRRNGNQLAREIQPDSRFDSGPQSPFLSLQAEFVAVSLAWFAVLGATALGGLL